MKYLAVDWGMKSIGMAASEGELAQPLDSFKIQGLQDGLDKVKRLATQYQVEFVVIGLPGGQMGEIIQKVSKELDKMGLKVIEADESLSSKDSLQVMLNLGVNKKKRKDDHSIAAALILQRYLDENH